MFLYVGLTVDPPEKPTRVRITPEAQPNCASGNQNQLNANVALPMVLVISKEIWKKKKYISHDWCPLTEVKFHPKGLWFKLKMETLPGFLWTLASSLFKIQRLAEWCRTVWSKWTDFLSAQNSHDSFFLAYPFFILPAPVAQSVESPL